MPQEPLRRQRHSTTVRVGVAGWSYRDWRGIVYPAPRRGQAARGSAELAALSALFDCVEINSSFYRCPLPRHSRRWLETVEGHPDFTFTAKVPREMTHATGVRRSEIRALGASLLRGLRPLVEARRLETVLAQFPPVFHDGPAARDRIAAVVESLRPLDVVVEIRHASFLRRRATTRPGGVPGPSFLAFLEGLGAGFANVDLPGGGSHPPPTTINTSAIGYVRLHGRNAGAWFDREAGRDETYDYLYGPGELGEWAARITELATRTRVLFVIANNHFRGQAPANALDLMGLLHRPLPEAIPSGLIETYPHLADTRRRSRTPAIPAEERP